MRWGVLLVVVMAVTVTGVTTTPGKITVSSGGYTNVVVAFSQSLNPDNCTRYIQTVKDMFISASKLLHSATGNKMYFKEVIIVIPSSWANSGCTPDTPNLELEWESSHVRIGGRHPIFGNNPWTEQLGRCGQPGNYIYISEDFLLNESVLGQKDQVLVAEWAKYRWGALEEYGHPRDPIFPMAYQHNSTDPLPNYCADGPVPGEFSDCNSGNIVDCVFTPDVAAAQNSSLTSSLLSTTFVPTVVNFCTAANHNSDALTKHNVLCGGQSSFQVISQHQDLSSSTSTNNSDPVFKITRETKVSQKTVFIVDYTSTMGSEKGRWEYLRDALRQFLLVEAEAGTEAGLVLFNSQIFNATSELTENMASVASIIPVDRPTGQSGTKNLQVAIERGVQMVGSQLGAQLLLVTENMVSYNLGNQNLVNAAAGLPVWPILYPNNPTESSEVYQDLARSTLGPQVLTVNNNLTDVTTGTVTTRYQSVENYATLTDHVTMVARNTLSKVDSQQCTQLLCTLSLNVASTADYSQEGYIEVLHSEFDSNGYEYTVTDPTGEVIESVHKEGTSDYYTLPTLRNGAYTVDVTSAFGATLVSATLRATPRSGGGVVEVEVGSPHSLDDLILTTETVPVLWVKVRSAGDGRLVVGAAVTAVVTPAQGGASLNLTFRDDGTGGDLTGNDGVYSAFLVWQDEPADVAIDVIVTDNGGAAQVVGDPARSAPVDPAGDIACCGSKLDLSSLPHHDTGPFEHSEVGVLGHLTGVKPTAIPPDQITDLRASGSGWHVTLTFTAPGDTLDQGTADHYTVYGSWPENADRVINNNTNVVSAGAEVVDTVKLPQCDVAITLSVLAYGTTGLASQRSNPVLTFVSCSHENGGLSAGAITGIVIGCILGLLLILMIIYLCLHRDNLDDLWLWQVLTCRCLRKDDDDQLYNAPPPRSARRTDVIRTNTSTSQPVRDLSDLYARPNLEAKTKARQAVSDDEEGGFRTSVKQTRSVADRASQQSSLHSHGTQNNLPINQVGLPQNPHSHYHSASRVAPQPPDVAQGYRAPPQLPGQYHSNDNYGYDDSSSDSHSHTGQAAPPSRHTRMNTQV